MRKTLSLGLLAVLTLSGHPFAAPGDINAADSRIMISSATLSISGTSTMHPYTVSTKTMKVASAVATVNDLKALLQPGALQGFELQLPLNAFVSDKDGLTKQMFRAMKADKHPLIAFRLGSYTVDSDGDKFIIKSAGTLTAAGVERPVDVVLDVTERAGGLRITGTR